MQLLSFTAVVSAPIIVLALTFKHLLNEKRMEEAEANEAAMDVEAALRQAEKVRLAAGQFKALPLLNIDRCCWMLSPSVVYFLCRADCGCFTWAAVGTVHMFLHATSSTTRKARLYLCFTLRSPAGPL